MGNSTAIIATSTKPLIQVEYGFLEQAYMSEIRPQIQVTLNCNLACDYCFQDHTGPVMTLDTASAIIDQLVQTFYATRQFTSDQNKLDIYWHGGEPLIAGVRFFQGVIDIQARYPGMHFVNHLQTNGTLMSDELARLLVDNKFLVGFSLDGPKSLHDLHRVTKTRGVASFDDALRGIELYQSYAKLDKIPIMMVVTKDSIDRVDEIYDFFHQMGADVGIDIYDVVADDLGGDDGSRDWSRGLAPSEDEIEGFLTRLFDRWFFDASRRVSFRELKDEVMVVLENERSGHNKGAVGDQDDTPTKRDPFHKKRCHFTRTIFTYDGNVYSCDQYINDEKSSLGNVHTHALKDIVMRKAVLWENIKQKVRGDRPQNAFACPSCEWSQECAGGCMTCMKYNSLLLTAREQGLEDEQWVEITSQPTPLDSIYGEFYYCSGLIRFRHHVREVVMEAMADE